MFGNKISLITLSFEALLIILDVQKPADLP
jgi:hypothetical protein